MECFRFVPPSIIAFSASFVVVNSMPAPAPQNRFLPPGLFQVPQTNPNQGLQNGLAGAGLGAVGAVAAGNCLFGGNCDLSFRPSLGVAVDANGQIAPQLGVTTQVGNGNGGIGTTFYRRGSA
eukprot:TRINITY_DN35209_c0_g1_i1.p1 TRINITY_DN35209_c0_g1~~TRINITY_DN35209_c0_g1_i1.p1  ORF type:complete len:122 (-),score=31.22 TRINITY_DN35209_c0_g1_i1:51-416(-)